MPACICRCHIGSIVDYPPDLRDPVAAVTACAACAACLNRHAVALVSEWPPAARPNPLLTPWVDPEPEPQADGGEKGNEDGG